MTLELLAGVALVLAAVPAAMVTLNLVLYRRPPASAAHPVPSVSVLIPARDEEATIRGAVESILSQTGVELEVVVMDDGSSDRTAEIVRELADADGRVRLERAPTLPAGWCGKQHACLSLSRAARHDVLIFVDADVRLEPGGLLRVVGELQRSGAELVSGIPRQRTGTAIERLVIPMVHLILLGYLPIVGMRLSRSPAFAAGCGQLVAVRRGSYERVGGHAAIKASRHDGITLPRSFRRAGLKTDLFDATPVASCRMYHGAGELWNGFAKNATEGMAGGAAILVWTVLLLGAHVVPWLLIAPAWIAGGPALTLAGTAIALGYVSRAALAVRFRQSWLGVLLHPLGVVTIVAIQWYARLLELSGAQVSWKGRAQRSLTAILVATLAYGVVPVVSVAATPASDRGSLTIRVSGLRGKDGVLAFAVYDSAQHYADRSAPVRSGFVPVDRKKLRVVVEDLPPGTYAVMFYQDRNDNRRLDRNMFGAPAEPYGFSMNARAPFGPPDFDAASFVFEVGMPAIDVRLH